MSKGITKGKPKLKVKVKRPRWRVHTATFELSAPQLSSCPPEDLPEIAVAGRSNVGKSSLLNAFAEQRGLARVSRTPGRTRLLNFFRVELAGPRDARALLRWVDLPGYGFAKARREVRDSFGPMIESYLRQREALKGLLVLVDARHGPRDSDFGLIEFCASIELPCLLCVTKCDKLGASERGLLPQRFAKSMGIDARDVLLTSAASGHGLTVDDRRGTLGEQLARLSRAPGELSVVPPTATPLAPESELPARPALEKVVDEAVGETADDEARGAPGLGADASDPREG